MMFWARLRWDLSSCITPLMAHRSLLTKIPLDNPSNVCVDKNLLDYFRHPFRGRNEPSG